MMNLYYHYEKTGNFGDDLNVWLWSRLLPNIVDVEKDYRTSRLDDKASLTVFVGIGTLLNNGLPSNASKVVFGSGAPSANRLAINDSWRIYCVRGPLTAQALGIEANIAITDGAVLLKKIDFPQVNKTFSVSFMPHHSSNLSVDWQSLCTALNMHYIDPTVSTEKTLEDIQRSELIITEAMHGAIVADVFRVPWIPVRLNGIVNSFKWQDWCQSLGLLYKPILPEFNLRLLRNPKLPIPKELKSNFNYAVAHQKLR